MLCLILRRFACASAASITCLRVAPMSQNGSGPVGFETCVKNHVPRETWSPLHSVTVDWRIALSVSVFGLGLSVVLRREAMLDHDAQRFSGLRSGSA